MIITFRDNGHHQTYDTYLREWIGQAESTIPLARQLHDQSVRLGVHFRRPYFWKKIQETFPEGTLFFSYWDDVHPFWLQPKLRLALCPYAVGAIWMNTWGFRTQGKINPQAWQKYQFLNDEHLTLGILDEGVVEALEQLPQNLKPRSQLYWMPDFTDVSLGEESDPLVQDVLQFSNGRKILLCVGVLNGFKNLILLNEVAQHLSSKEWVVVVLGEVHDREGINRLKGKANIFVKEGRISSEKVMNTLIKNSHLIWGAYDNWEGSSNIQIKAGLLGVPILCLEGFLMGERNRRYGLGLTATKEEILDLSRCNFDVLKSWNPDKISKSFEASFRLKHAKERFLIVYSSVKLRQHTFSFKVTQKSRILANSFFVVSKLYRLFKGFPIRN